MKKLLDNPHAARQPAVIVDENKHVAVRSERYRYIRYKDGSEELYDHKSDPNEWQNLAGRASLGEIKAQLRQRVPKSFATSALSKRAFSFDAEAYQWTSKATGNRIDGGTCRIVPSGPIKK